MEDEDQLGLAHLIEHMVFNGTKNFPKDSIDKYFTSIGLSIGADYNASTGYETTFYKYSIPTEKKENIEKGIHILSEISNFAILDDESFEKERKIVEEEWRRGQGRKKRLYEELKEYLYLNSKYAKRMTIGDINIIRNFPNDTARRFYNDWYRPDFRFCSKTTDKCCSLGKPYPAIKLSPNNKTFSIVVSAFLLALAVYPL